MANYSLSPEKVQAYRTRGYLVDLPPVFTAKEMAEHRANYEQILTLLEPGETPKDIREWHETSRWLYDICMHPPILDMVESLIGSNFYVWASGFFSKAPRSPDTVGWHQDAYYWPLAPHNTVTVWLAFVDSDEGNGAMNVIPGSHLAGTIQHNRQSDTDSVLSLELEEGSFALDTATPICLKAGQISIHDDRIVHGSGANPSDRPRIGLTIRYSGTNVKCDLSVNPHFRTYLCRGVDRYKHNPVGEVPTQALGRLYREHRNFEETGKA